jgi:MmpS family membrane protein
MSGPNPPGPESDELEPGVGPSQGDSEFEQSGSGFGETFVGETASDSATGQTDVYSRAYSAPESEHISSGPYVPANLDLYDYDNYGETDHDEPEGGAPRWPWIVGIAAIVAAIALVVSVSLLFARTDTTKLATPSTAPTSTPPIQDEITTTTPRPAPPPSSEPPPQPSSSEPPPPPPPPSSEPPPPPPAPAPAPAPAPVPAPAPPAPAPEPAPAGPKQVTYSVTGTKAPFDQITISYTDGSGMRRIMPNVYIPWTITLTPISQSEVGSIEATSLLRLSKLNCKITTSDGKVLADNENNQPQATCG